MFFSSSRFPGPITSPALSCSVHPDAAADKRHFQTELHNIDSDAELELDIAEANFMPSLAGEAPVPDCADTCSPTVSGSGNLAAVDLLEPDLEDPVGLTGTQYCIVLYYLRNAVLFYLRIFVLYCIAI